MCIVGDNQRNAKLFGEFIHQRNDDLVIVEPMVLQFEKEVMLPEDVLVLTRQASRLVVLVG